MAYLNEVFNNICKGYVSPNGVKNFLDLVFDSICDYGFTEQHILLFKSMLKFDYLLFSYDETKNHIMKEVISM